MGPGSLAATSTRHRKQPQHKDECGILPTKAVVDEAMPCVLILIEGVARRPRCGRSHDISHSGPPGPASVADLRLISQQIEWRDAQRLSQLGYSVTTVGLRRPCSSPLIYCWLKPDSSSTCSWVRPLSRRIRAKLRPTSRRMSMPAGMADQTR